MSKKKEAEVPWEERLPPDLLKMLKDPRNTLPAFGKILDQKTGQQMDYDPDRICGDLQWSLMDFMGDTPRTESGQKKWMAVIAPRQVGKSVLSAYSTYCGAAYQPGSYSAIIADTRERAQDLFRNLIQLHDNLPAEIRMPTRKGVGRESNQLTFESGAKIRTLSAEQGMVGIGRAIDHLHASEVPFWTDAAGTWNALLPAFINRSEASIVFESTPAPLSMPSAQFYRDICEAARKGEGRWEFKFVSYFQSSLNERIWKDGWVLTQDEAKLMEKYGPKDGQPESNPGDQGYMTLENIAFRREVMDLDPEIRRHPDLFNVFFPKDYHTCWVDAGGSVIPERALERHRNAVLVPWSRNEFYKEYADPRPGAIYVMGVDPAGWGGGDSAAFQVLECWEDEWRQVACFASNEIDYIAFAEKIIETALKYNDASVLVENNGVGAGTLATLIAAERSGSLKNLVYLARGIKAKPGVAASSKSINEAMGLLIDALMDRLVIHDEETVVQLGTYRQDKLVTTSEKSQLLNPGKVGRGRRAKHHWDRCSALLWAVKAATMAPVRFKPVEVNEDPDKLVPAVNPTDSRTWTAAMYDERQTKKPKSPRAKKREARRKSKRRRTHWTVDSTEETG